MASEPRIVAFLCNWCAYQAADRAGQARLGYPQSLLTVRVMCTGRVEPAFVLQAFREGADGVLVAGCHPGDCHYAEGNLAPSPATRCWPGPSRSPGSSQGGSGSRGRAPARPGRSPSSCAA